MRELSRDAQSILDEVRNLDNPSERDRKRLTAAMITRLGAAAVVSSSAKIAAGSGAAAAASGLSVSAKVLASLAVVGSVASGALLLAAPVPRNAVTVSSHARSTSTAAILPPGSKQSAHNALAMNPAPERAEAESQVPKPAVESAASKLDRTSSALRVRARPQSPDQQHYNDSLAREVQTLSKARALLRAGQPERALSVLDEQRATFDNGALREEYLAARMIALRELGRVSEARAAEAQFKNEMPDSALRPNLVPLPAESR